ncbi:hypothetical protein HF325_001451 [Metschnikowia pulcherrima]|uniref:Uncharacterized protein n=1 Tax=Metschnikowia pulcherrima TaxID=27326 RepID=A0A8H7LDN8_9ASCO|nr:hypothetical protein HF325_001451 [Metschnikowia pulcherrima]
MCKTIHWNIEAQDLMSKDISPEDKAFETVKNYVGDKELYELIFGQFLQPRISDPRAIAKYSRLLGKGCSSTRN